MSSSLEAKIVLLGAQGIETIYDSDKLISLGLTEIE